MDEANGRANTEDAASAAARDYRERWWSPIPIKNRSKAPKLPKDHPFLSRRATDEEFEGFDFRHNVGIVTGRVSGIIVLDDDDHGETLRRNGWHVPATPTVKTRRGHQYYFRSPEAGFPTFDVAGKLEVRGDGAYVVAPPSIHPDGNPYEWVIHADEAEIAAPPAWLIEQARIRGRRMHAEDVGETIPNGARNKTLFSIAGTLRRRGLDEGSIAAALLGINETKCETPLDDDEVRRIAQGIIRYEPAESAPSDNGRDPAEDAGARSGDSEARPEIVAVARDTKDVLADCAAALVRANDPPTMFVRGGMLSMIARDEDGAAGIKPLPVDALRGRLAHAARFVRVSRKDELVPIPPPKEMAQMLHAASEWPGVPPLVGLSGVPVLRPDGTVHDAPGYDAGSRIFYDTGPSRAVLAHGELPPKVPSRPSRSDVRGAREGIAELLQDFPFASATDRANAWGMLLTPIARPWIAGPVPLALIDKPKMGSGASLLAAAVATVATGHAPFLGAPSSEEEWSKVITSALLAGQTVLIFDNIAERIDSAALSRALTSPTWADRLLGTNTVAHVPQRATWIATGNNIAVGGDMPRRCYRIRLDPKVSKPWQREGFAIPNLAGWALQNRGRLVASLLTLCVDWHRAGRPAAGEDRPRIGGFEGWDRTISGILAHAGIGDFLTNLDEFYEAADEDGAEWAAFLATWHERVGAHAITLQDLVGRFATIEGREIRAALPADLAETFEHNERGFTRRLGRALAKRTGARYGDEGYFAEEAGEHNRAKKWIVRTDSIVG